MITDLSVKKSSGKSSLMAEKQNFEFGKSISDHMFEADYKSGSWIHASIKPFQSISLSPAALGLHYGQTVFEGMKAFRMDNGSISIFRIEKHYERFCRSLKRMCMPVPSFDLFKESLIKLISTDHEWVPGEEGSSLYIRPFMFASEERFGVSVSLEYKFIIFTGPVKSYYPRPLRVKIEDTYIRAAAGGTGYAKCGGNYGGAFYPTELAKAEGFDQVIWTDLSKDLNIEESGTMNIMLVIDDVVITPALSDTTLDGVTRDSYITLAGKLGYKVEQRKIPAQELINAIKHGKYVEAFGSGTAAVASPIQVIHYKGVDYILPEPSANGFMNKAKRLLSDIRTGKTADTYGWNTIIIPEYD